MEIFGTAFDNHSTYGVQSHHVLPRSAGVPPIEFKVLAM